MFKSQFIWYNDYAVPHMFIFCQNKFGKLSVILDLEQ